MAILNFNVAYSTTLEGAISTPISSTVFAEDLENCPTCLSITSSCWACLTTEQQVFSDAGLTSPVPDGYYRVEYSVEDPNAIWHIIGGYPQGGEFYN
jgi:hypothetical protein